MENQRGRKKGSKVKAKPLPIECNSEEFIAILHGTISNHHKIGVLLGWASGLRVSEVVNVQKNDFNFEGKFIRINMGKNSKDRIVPMPVWVCQEYVDKYIPIPCVVRSLQKAFESATIRSGVKATNPKIHYHSLRHGFATHCLRMGMPLIIIQQAMGHSDVSTTSIYTNLTPTEMLNWYQNSFTGGLNKSS